MSVSTIFLNQHLRFAESLTRFDPFKGEPLLRWVDPIGANLPANPEKAAMPLGRIAAFSGIVILPEVICSLIPDLTLGGGFWGRGGMNNSIGQLSQFLAFLCCALLLPLGRRLMGNLVSELSKSGVVVLPRDLDISLHGGGRFLRFAEAVTRPTRARCAAWLVGVFLWNTAYLYAFLSDNKPGWATSPATNGSLFYFLHVGSEQPNLAGIFQQSLFSAVYGYLIVLAARLFIAFACVCQIIAHHESLHILPTDPDGTGGLLPLGQVSLFLSLFTLLAGVNNAGLTFQLILDAIKMGGSVVDQGLFEGLMVAWILYVTLGPLLLFLPIWPLRGVMARAKREYLLAAKQFYKKVELDHRAHIENNVLDNDALEGQASLAALIETAGNMGIWPFDRKTLFRFAGVFLSPVIPLITSQWPKIYPWLHAYLLPST